MLHSIIGLMNSGKTLFMTYKAYIDYKKGRKIYSNYNLSFPHELLSVDQINDFGKNPPYFNNTSIFLDEAHLNWDSRSSIKNTYFTAFILQSSKCDLNIYLTSQDNRQQDIRIRNNMHFLTACERVLFNPSDNRMHQITEADRILPLEVQKYLYISFKTWTFKLCGLEKQMYLYQNGNLRAEPIFKFYNTHEKIAKK